jgi:hypothetical protein
MGAKQSASGGGTSPGESKARVGTTEITGTKNAEKAQIKVIGKRADDKARERLNIQKIRDAGYRSLNNPYGDTTQMYGDIYNQARGEYLSSLGLAKRREVTDAMGKKSITYDPRTASGTYNNLSRGSMNEAKAYRTPLSEDMYKSQQMFKAGLAGMTALMGAPLIPSLLTASAQQPYSNYLSNTENKGFYTEPSSQGMMNKDRTGSIGTPIAFNEETEAQAARRKRMASRNVTGENVKGSRNLFQTLAQTFGGQG